MKNPENPDSDKFTSWKS